MSKPSPIADASRVIDTVAERIESAAIVDRSVLLPIVAASVARGHVLLEDVPGTGKTVIARVFAEAFGLEFTRIQFTPDLLPSDVTGSMIYNEHDGEFRFAKGPVFTNVLLADEINRAPPKTQAALLEAMEERQVSIDGTTYALPKPFLVIATQNPIEQEGTFQLPEAQRDRFSVKTALGYPDADGEMELLERRANRQSLAPTIDPAVTEDTLEKLQRIAETVEVDPKVRRYIIDLARETRSDPRTEMGVSPRGVQRVFEAARATAVIFGREYVRPSDIKRLARPAMAHRLVLRTDAVVEGIRPETVIEDALERVAVPGVATASEPQPTAEKGMQPTTEVEATAPTSQNGGSADSTDTPSAEPAVQREPEPAPSPDTERSDET